VNSFSTICALCDGIIPVIRFFSSTVLIMYLTALKANCFFTIQ
jgi:hypothetical protein